MSRWTSDNLQNLVSFKKGKKVETSIFAQQGYLKYLGAGSLVGNDDGFASTQFAVLATENDVLMLWDGERSGLVGHGLKGVVSSTVSKLTPSERLSSSYLYYFLLNKFDWIQNRRTGTGVPHVPKDLGRILSVNFPKKLSHQDEITTILNAIDRTIEKTEALIEKYQQIKSGLMHDLFTRGVTADGKLRPTQEQAPELYQETPIGWIPKDWIFTNCKGVCEKIIDCKNRTPPVTPDGHPVIRTPNVRNGNFVDQELTYTDSASYLVWTARGKPKVDDVVITREAPVGEVCKIPERHPRACLGQRMMLYRTDPEKIYNDFFLYALQSKAIQNRLDLISGGSTVGHVRVGDIRDLYMFHPKTKKEQQQIASSLNHISSKIETEVNLCEKLRKLKAGLMHDLLTGKVQVKTEELEATHV